jgi:hypothetical protein
MKIKTTHNRGIHIIHDDGTTFSLQWGVGNYCENKNLDDVKGMMLQITTMPDAESSNCEVAVFDASGARITNEYFETNDCIAGYVDIKEALDIAINNRKLKNVR